MDYQKRLDDDDRVFSAQQQIKQFRTRKYFVPIVNTRANDITFADPKWFAMWHLVS